MYNYYVAECSLIENKKLVIDKDFGVKNENLHTSRVRCYRYKNLTVQKKKSLFNATENIKLLFLKTSSPTNISNPTTVTEEHQANRNFVTQQAKNNLPFNVGVQKGFLQLLQRLKIILQVMIQTYNLQLINDASISVRISKKFSRRKFYHECMNSQRKRI